jgi:uncharacterized membrane protein
MEIAGYDTPSYIRSIVMKRFGALVLVALLLVAAVPVQAGSCWECRYSANSFGNCRLADEGYTSCTRVVADSFSGRTDCSLGGYCFSSGGGGGENCWWTDLDGNCIFAY